MVYVDDFDDCDVLLKALLYWRGDAKWRILRKSGGENGRNKKQTEESKATK